MHDALTLRGQLSALTADLIPRTGGSLRWGDTGVCPVRHAPTQDRVFCHMVKAHEYSIHDLADILPSIGREGIRSALSALARRGLLTCRKSFAVPGKVSSGRGGGSRQCARPMLLYTRTS